ncbi:hypothetical protein BH11PLA1_BH11PLA1_06230 [soil metagenome]
MSNQTTTTHGNMVRNAPPAPFTRAPLTLEDFTKDLLWPRLLRAPGLALAPSRVLLAFAALAVFGGLSALVHWATRRDFNPGNEPINTSSLWSPGRTTYAMLGDLLGQFPGLPTHVEHWTLDHFFTGPWNALRESPWYMCAVILPSLAVFAILGGAICRSAACEFSLNIRMPWPRAVGFSLARWSSFVLTLLGPLLVVWAISGGLWLFGLLFRVPVLDVIAALLFPLALLAALLAAVVTLVFSFAGSLVIPAVAAEGTDGFDGVQRVYAFATSRPLRLGVYFLIGLAISTLALGVAYALVNLAVMLCDAAMGIVTTTERQRSLLSAATEAPGATLALAGSIVRFFTAVLIAAVTAYGISLYFCLSTITYLLIRQVVDGQDVHELWMPGVSDATVGKPDAPTPLAPGTMVAPTSTSPATFTPAPAAPNTMPPPEGA